MLFVDKEEHKSRLGICEKCDKRNKLNMCAECGCFIITKTKLKNAECPLNKWVKIDNK